MGDEMPRFGTSVHCISSHQPPTPTNKSTSHKNISSIIHATNQPTNLNRIKWKLGDLCTKSFLVLLLTMYLYMRPFVLKIQSTRTKCLRYVIVVTKITNFFLLPTNAARLVSLVFCYTNYYYTSNLD